MLAPSRAGSPAAGERPLWQSLRHAQRPSNIGCIWAKTRTSTGPYDLLRLPRIPRPAASGLDCRRGGRPTP
jgi:hypothetical protein